MSMDEARTFRGKSTAGPRDQVERAGSPVPSCVSMKSDESMEKPENFRGESTAGPRDQVERAGSPVPSCVSMKSDESMEKPENFRGESTAGPRDQVERAGLPVPSCVSMKSDESMEKPENFRGESTAGPSLQWSLESSCVENKGPKDYIFMKKSLKHTLMKLKEDELKQFQSHLNQNYPECTERQQAPDALHIIEKMLETCGSDTSLKITLHILRNMEQKDLADSLERNELKDAFERTQSALKSQLRKKFECIFEGFAQQGHPTLLNEIYTELYITEGGGGGVNNEHELRHIEIASKRQTTQTTQVSILCNDIFKPLPGQEKHIRTVLTKGIAGIGKTVSVQKFILDWVEGKANQDVDLIFPLPFRDLNLKREREFSLAQLLQHYFPQLKEIEHIEDDEVKVVFIFDGLDECRLPLDFQNNEICCDVTESASVDVLLTNLIKGNLLPSALLWITSRPAAANQIPPECVHQVTEVRGFNDPQKEEYFRKRISDKNLASKIISQTKSSRSLYIMCHIPVFCWISATVLGRIFGKADSGKLPTTLTEMYTHFLLIQINVKNQKYHDTNKIKTKRMLDAKIILKLGRLAYLQLEKGNLIFYEEDLRESGIDVSEASVYSGVCTEVFKEESGLHQEKVYSFVHLSVQEYLAALFAFHSCVNENRNVLRQEKSRPEGRTMQLSELHRSAVDQALQSKNGHLDLFLRFLLGLSLDSIQGLFGELLTKKGSGSLIPSPVTQTGSRSPEPGSLTHAMMLALNSIGSLFGRGLRQRGSRSLEPGPQAEMGSRPRGPAARKQAGGRTRRMGQMTQTGITPPAQSSLTRRLRGVLDSITSAFGELTLRGSTPLMRYVRRLFQHPESRSESIRKTLQYLKQKIRQESSGERTINLFHCLNELNDNSLVEEIQIFLRSGRLSNKELEANQCSALTFVLLMSEEVLDEFDLKTYITSAAGRQRLVPVVRNCRKAILDSCNLTKKSCEIVVSALQISDSPLTELDLSFNDMGDSGVKLLCAGLMSSNCNVQRLGLGCCNLTEGCCDDMASVLRSPHSQLRDLELRDNQLEDSGVRALSTGLEDPHCKLQRLGLSGCQVTQRGCDSLASALRSNPSHLRELDLSYNHPGDSGVRALSAAKLDTLTLLVDHGGESRTKPGPRKYGCQLTLDPDTASRELSLSEENRKVTWKNERQPYPNHPDRFDSMRQVMCRESLSGRCYWEAQWSLPEGGWVHLTLAYKGIRRKGWGRECTFGKNKHSWSLECYKRSYTLWHDENQIHIPVPPSPFRRVGVRNDGEAVCVYRVGVCVDPPAGTLSFYSVSGSDTLTLLCTYHTDFSDYHPLCAGFAVYGFNSSVSLCQME